MADEDQKPPVNEDAAKAADDDAIIEQAVADNGLDEAVAALLVDDDPPFIFKTDEERAADAAKEGPLVLEAKDRIDIAQEATPEPVDATAATDDKPTPYLLTPAMRTDTAAATPEPEAVEAEPVEAEPVEPEPVEPEPIEPEPIVAETTISDLETKLNQPIGEILESYGIVSTAIKDEVGHIQAVTIAVARHYDSLDDEAKAAFAETKFNDSVPVLKPKRNGDGMEFNDAIIFTIADELKGQNISAEEKATFINTKLGEALDGFGISPEQRAEAEKIVASREGSNPDPALSTATPITPIYKAIDRTFGQSGNILSAIHLALRSGAARVPAGLQDEAAAERAFKTNFANGPFERDPQYIKDMLAAGAVINAYERGAEDAPVPTKDEIEVIAKGFETAKNELNELAEKQTIGADFSALLKDIEDYQAKLESLRENEWKAFWEQQERKQARAAAVPGIVIGAPEGTDGGEDTDPANEADDLAEPDENAIPLSELLKESYYSNFYGALKTAVGEFNVNEKIIESMHSRGEFKWLADTLVSQQKNDKNQVVFTGLQGHKFIATADKIQHIDNDDNFSPEEALQYAMIAFSNKRMCKEGITITGSPHEQAMILAAVRALNPKGIKGLFFRPITKIHNERQIKVPKELQRQMNEFAAEARSGKTKTPETAAAVKPPEGAADIASARPDAGAIKPTEAIKQAAEPAKAPATEEKPAPIPTGGSATTAPPKQSTDKAGIPDDMFTAVAEKVVSAKGGIVTKNEIQEFLKAANFNGSIQKGYEAVRDRLEADNIIQLKPGRGWKVLVKDQFSGAASGETAKPPVQEQRTEVATSDMGLRSVRRPSPHS